MFPFDLDDDEDIVQVDEEKTEPVDYEIDFTTGKLTGRIIRGLPAIEQWIRLALGTERYFYTQFSWDYGGELQDLIGRNYQEEYIHSEVKRMIADALSVNKDIDSISNVNEVMDNDKMIVTFTVNTVYGSREVSLNV